MAGRRRFYRRKRRNRKWMVLGMTAILVVLISAVAIHRKSSSVRSTGYNFAGMGIYGRDSGTAEQTVKEGEVRKKLQELAETNEQVAELLERAEQFPYGILEMVANNEETAGFALGWPEKKDTQPAADVGELVPGEIPLLLQWDERWGYAGYGDGLLGYTGCGPTALAMVVTGLTGDSSVTPYKVAQYAEKNGYYAEGQGTAWSLMTEGCQQFGVQGMELPLDQHVIFTALENGQPIICSMRPGDFTATGHYIVLTAVKEGKLEIHDPNSLIRSNQLWDYETIEPQIKNLWAYTL